MVFRTQRRRPCLLELKALLPDTAAGLTGEAGRYWRRDADVIRKMRDYDPELVRWVGSLGNGA